MLTVYFPPEIGSASHLSYKSGSKLVKRGLEVSVITGFQHYHPHEVAAESKTDIIRFSFTTNQKQSVDRYLEVISKELDAVEIAGGVHLSITPEDSLEIGFIQGVCIGEGEFPLLELPNGWIPR
jgi:radical SAM superfamily enzyme YgiQ (UPF0313 family)